MRFALRRSAASTRVEVSVAGDLRSTQYHRDTHARALHQTRLLDLPSFVLRSTMPTVQGIGRKKKKRKLAPAAPAKEVTPEKDDAPEVDDEAPDADMLDMIEGLADLALELVVEELIDVDKMVELQMTRLHKREAKPRELDEKCS